MKKVIFTFLAFVGFLSVNAQTTLAFQGFQQDAADTWATTFSTAPCTSGADRWDYSTDLSSILPSEGTHFWGITDLNGNCGGTGFETISFTSVSTAGETGVAVSFDYNVIGFDSGDDMKYEVFHDGVSQGEVLFVDGASNFSTGGWETITIQVPDAVNAVEFKLFCKQNGGDFGAWDNVKIESGFAIIPEVSFDVAAASGVEGDAGNTPVLVSISIDEAPTADVVVDIISVGATATEGTDYAAVSTTLTFTPTGPMTQDITLNIIGDMDIETNETLNLLLALSPTNTTTATIGLDTYEFTILDDDTPLPNIRINEVDSDQVSTDADEFVELFGDPNLALDGISLVFFNGNGDNAYMVFDLDGFTTDANGFFIVGNIAGAEIAFSGSTGAIQNGADGVALYLGDFNNGDPATQASIIDALVYDTNDADDTGLMTALGVTEQINEDENGAKDDHSIQRGSWFVAPPTPRAVNMPLPVDLISFNAKLDNKATQLVWQTALEVNNDYFQVEYSTNGVDFEAIGKERGQGESYDLVTYSFTHDAPAKGMNYYRLKQVDFDGGFEYSPVVTVEMLGKGVSIYPNPATDVINVQVEAEAARVEIFNINGQLIQTQVLDNGIIAIANLVEGQYVLRVIAGNEVMTTTFVKQ